MNNLQTLQSDLGVDPFAAIDRANLANSTRRQYKRQLELYLESGHSLGNPNQLLECSQTLKGSSRSFLKAAVRLWPKRLNGKLRPAPAHVAVGIADQTSERNH